MKKLLLIEDNLDVRENTAEILELANFDVVTAENGKIGVQKARSLTPDLIICDIMMPDLDGYGVLHILSKDPVTSSIPFIFLTAKAEKSDFRKGMNLGADDYLTKPFDETELLDAIESRLKRNSQMKTTFDKTEQGVNQFINEAKSLADLHEVASTRKTKTYKKKEYLFREGDFSNGVHFLVAGKVKMFKINEDGKEFVTSLINKGEFFGYTAILKGEEYHESAVAMEDCEVCSIQKQEFQDLVYTNRDVASKFIKMLSNDIIDKEEELLELAYNTVRKRVADALLKLRDKFQDNDDEFSISISRSDLASMVGTAQESVIRFLSEFKDDGYIAVKGSKIKIVNSTKLEELKY